MKTKFIAFIIGLLEFRQSETTHFEDDFITSYDWGREIAHRLTFRILEN